MIPRLAQVFLEPAGKTKAQLRKDYGILCGAVGIALNTLLFAGKLLAGTLSGSIAITADAFNNLSDAGSSFVTLMGFKLAGQKPDSDHPFGHGRFEYLSGLVVSMLIFLMGFELAKSSVSKIFHPEPVEFSILTLIILAVSIAVKLYMAFYNKQLGKQLDSTAMLATAADSLSDSIATFAVLVATLVGHFTNLLIDGWVGTVVALLILRAGISSAKDTIDPLLGTPPSQEFVTQIREIVMKHDGIQGIHDLIVHDYGPGRCMISLHAEVSADDNVLHLHDSIDHIERELQETLGCHAVIHMDPLDTRNELTEETRQKVLALVRCIDEGICIHDFRMVSGPTHTNVIFDAVVPFSFHLSDAEVENRIKTIVRTLDGNYFAVVTVERSYT